jgi:hypothetical protein
MSLVGAVLLVGAWVNPSGAAVKAPPRYTESDCGVIENIVVKDDASNGGYWGKTARNASKAFKTAAKKIEDKGLKKSMTTLSDVWKRAANARDVVAAAATTARFGKRYGNALGVYTKATVTCASQEASRSLEETSTTEPSTTEPSTTEPPSSDSE